MRTWLLLLASSSAAKKLDSTTLLTSLDPEYAAAPWSKFWEDRGSKGRRRAVAFTKQLQAAGPAVVKVLAKADVPVRALLDCFLSEDADTVAQWNPFTGDVRHFDAGAQVQTYPLPWPFASREYLVRCTNEKTKGVHVARCTPLDLHPSAPVRSDRVRGRSETIWRFSSERDGSSTIHLETLVDPRGGLPSWVVDKVGKSAAVKIVTGLVRVASARVAAATATAKSGAAGGRAAAASLSPATGASGECAAGDEWGWGRSFIRSSFVSRWLGWEPLP